MRVLRLRIYAGISKINGLRGDSPLKTLLPVRSYFVRKPTYTQTEEPVRSLK